MSEVNCAICCQIAGQETGDLLGKLLKKNCNYIRHTISESQYFAVFPSVGPLKLGHVILCPKVHCPSFACLPGAVEEEYEPVRLRLVEILKAAFGVDVHVFEHGTDAKCSHIPCSVEHAHQHFLPANIDIWDALRDGIEWSYIRSDIASLRQAVQGREYLYYRSPNGRVVLALAEKHPFESQYIRRVFAQALGKPDEWNWRVHPSPQAIEETFTVLSSALRSTPILGLQRSISAARTTRREKRYDGFNLRNTRVSFVSKE